MPDGLLWNPLLISSYILHGEQILPQNQEKQIFFQQALSASEGLVTPAFSGNDTMKDSWLYSLQEGCP